MPLTPTDLITLSRLLDEAMDLAPAQAERWLAALPEEHAHLRRKLQEMLAAHRADSHPAFMANGPKLAGPTDETVTRVGELIGPYRLIREIGHGGMGTVWLAERADGTLKRQVALKLPRLAWGAGLVERMARERDIGALLEHPNIARLYDAGVDAAGRPYLALEYIDGQPMDAWCEAQALSIRDRLKLVVQVARAVAYAHGRLVVHRDLKPSNVLVTANGQVHLLDFGIAKLLHEAAPGDGQLTQEQGRVLTPHYASPEQIKGETITVASDVYSLGVLLYELLTGTLPITTKRSSLGAMEDAVLAGDAPLASSRVKNRDTVRSLRGEVDAILAKALQREPTRRYATADALAQDIERHLNGETVAAQPDSAMYRLRKTVRRHWLGVSATTAVLVAVLTGTGVAAVQAQRATRSAERERVVKAFVIDVFRVNSHVDPANAALRPASTQALLEGGARLIQQRFAGQPDLQAELFGVVGNVFLEMGAYRLAADYATRQVESLTLLHAESPDQVRALLALAQALAKDEQLADAELRVRKALELARDDKPLVSESLMLLSEVLFELGRPEESRAALLRVEGLLPALGGSASSLEARALAQRGELLYQLNRTQDAIPLMQQAIDIAEAREGRLSTTAIAIRLRLAYVSVQVVRDDLARAQLKAALQALRELGGVHEVRAAMESADFAQELWINGRHGTAADAINAIKESRDALAAMQIPIPDWMLSRLQFMLGNVLVWYGNVHEGLLLMEPHAEALLAIAPTPKIESNIASSLATGLFYAGRHDAAARWYRRTIEINRRRGLAGHPYYVTHFANASINLMMGGKYQEALAVLDEAPSVQPAAGEGSVNPGRWARYLQWQRAEVLLNQGENAAALRLLKATAPIDGEAKDDIARFNEKLGVVLCVTGRTRDGLALLKWALGAVVPEDESSDAPWTAHLRTRTGLCALASGERAYAIQMATQARAAFKAQPDVSPYFKAPLFNLERALGLKLPPV